MQVATYCRADIDFLFRKEVEARLAPLVEKSREDEMDYETRLFDCQEFGFCKVQWSPQLQEWTYEWFSLVPFKSRRPKPRIAATVTVVDGVTGRTRRRWQFAMSKLGFLYPVSYHAQKVEHGLWTTQEIYESWHKHRDEAILTVSAIPDDSICREAERLYKARRR